MSDWYARKLAELRGAPAAAPPPAAAPVYPPTAPLQPGQLPPHLAPYAQPPAPPQYAAQPQPGYGQQGPAGTPQQPPQQMPGQQYFTYNAETGAQVADDGHVAALVMAAQTGGSTMVKNNSAGCPNCGGGNYFTVQEGGVFSKAAGGRVNAMQCADCNFPNVQAGSQGGALSGARSGGPARPARQLSDGPRPTAPGHRVTVIGEGGQAQTFEPPTGR